MAKIVCIIPARGGSKSIPKKNIIQFCGKPLIAWTIKRALESKFIEDVYVTTDDPEIGKIALRYDAKIIHRPKRFARDNSRSEDALAHTLSEIEGNGDAVKLIVFLQATSPLRDSKDIDNAIREFYSKGADSMFSAAMLEDYTIWSKNGRRLTSLSFDYKHRQRRQDRKPLYLENGSIYIFKPKILKKYGNRLGGKMIMYTMDLWKSYEIDNLHDLEICEHFMKKKILNIR